MIINQGKDNKIRNIYHQVSFIAILYLLFFVITLPFMVILPAKAMAATKDFKITNSVLVKYSGNSKYVVIPDTVTEIGNNAFSDQEQIQSIKLPSSITKIGNNAFYNCTGLKKINIPDKVTHIGEYAFAYCGLLNVSISIPAKIKWIGIGAFSNCTNLTNVTLPENMTSIPDNAFTFCTSLKKIKIPEAVISIGNYAFSECKNLASIVIPATVTQIGSKAFDNTAWLKTMSKKTPLIIINHILYDASTCTGVVTVPKGVTEIGERAFQNSHAREIILPESVTKIGEASFATSSLKKITLPDGITEIGNSAFSDSHLTDITLPASLTSISDFMFFRCQHLKSIEIPDGVTNIGFKAFAFCSRLKKVILPKSLTTLGRDIFYRDILLSNIKIHPENPNYTVQGKFLLSHDKTQLLYGFNLVGDIIIPEGIESIAENVFYDCDVTKLTLPSTLKVIANDTIHMCDNLTEINLPSSLSQFGDQKLEYCKKLSHINVYEANNKINFSSENGILYNADKTKLICNPSSGDIEVSDDVTSIGNYAFPNVGTSVIIPKSVTSFGNSIFNSQTLCKAANEPQFYVYGYDGSAIEKYCAEHEINFLAFDKTYKITYVLNGGTNNSKNPASYNYQSPAIVLRNPTRAGYNFLYWYKDVSICEDGCCRGELKINSIPEESLGDIELIAKWKKLD